MMKKLFVISLLLFVSAVKADQVKVTYTSGDIEDSEIYGAALSDSGFGGRILLRTDSVFSGTSPVFSLIRIKNLSSHVPAGATITDAICSVYVYDAQVTSGDVSAYRVFKPWVEGTENNAACANGCSFNKWDCASGFSWTTAGCQNADDAGSDNSGDGTGADRKSTPESTVSMSSTNGVWYGFDISNALAQGWLDGTINQEGVILRVSDASSNNKLYRSTECACGNEPFFVFTYTPASGGQKVMIRK